MAGFSIRICRNLKIITSGLTCCTLILLNCTAAWCASVATEQGPKPTLLEKEQLVQRAVENYEQKKIDEARQDLERAQTEFPENYAVPYYLGLIYLEQENLKGAIEQWQRYVRMDPKSENAQNIRRNITLLLRKQAREYAKKAVAQETALMAGPSDENSLAVTSFHNLGSEILGSLGKGLAAMLITDLSHVPDLHVVDRIKLQALLEEMALGTSGLVDVQTAPKVGKLLKARHVTSGSMADLEKERLVIASAVIETDQKTNIGAQEAKGALNAFFALEKQIACQIVKDIGRDCEDMPAAFNEIHTKSVPALTAYSQGLDFFDEENYDQAREMFQKALEYDPQFNLAAVALLTTPTSAMLMMSTPQIISTASSSGPSSAAGTAVSGTAVSGTAGSTVAGTTTAATTTTIAAGSVGIPPVTAIAGGAAIIGGGVALAGGGGGGGGGEPTPEPSSLTGDWRGTWVDGNGTSGEAIFSLTQTNNSVTGTVSITGDDCITTGNITGTVSGTNANFTIQSGDESVTVDAIADHSAQTFNGTWRYQVSTLGCTGENGNFSTALTTGGTDIKW